MDRKNTLRIENQRLNNNATWDVDDTGYFHFILDPQANIENQGEPRVEAPLLGASTGFRYFAQVVDNITAPKNNFPSKKEKEAEKVETESLFKDIGKEPSSITASCSCPGKDDTIFTALLGITMFSGNLAVIEPERILIRVDHDSMFNKVKLLSGGAAGHEPFFSQYVGFGLLTAAVYGDMTGGPSPNQILTALRELNSPCGILMIVRNDLSERLSFGLALERARADGILVDMIAVSDDCWESQENPVGRRGLCGIIPLIKIAGAMSEKRKSMNDIFLMCRGLCITSISAVFPVQSYVKIGTDLNGLGGKILGKREMPEIISEMVKYMVDEKKYLSTSIFPLNRFIVVINSYKYDNLLLGSLTNQLFHELSKVNICVERLYSGTFISTPMDGYSFTLLKDIGQELIQYFDFRVPSRAWPLYHAKLPVTVKKTFFHRKMYEPGPICGITLLNGPHSNPIFRRYCEECITEACRAVILEEFSLNRLDPAEHYGSMITIGARALLEEVSLKRLEYDWPYLLMSQISDVLENCILGGIGTLYGIFFSGISLSLLSYSASVCLDFEKWIFVLKQGINAMASMAHYRLGDCTLLDALHPFYKALLPSPSDKFFLHRLRDAVTAASLGADSTALMKSNRHNLRQAEPGAETVAIILKAVYETANRQYEADMQSSFDPTNIPCPVGLVEIKEDSKITQPTYIECEEQMPEMIEEHESELEYYGENELKWMMDSAGVTGPDEELLSTDSEFVAGEE